MGLTAKLTASADVDLLPVVRLFGARERNNTCRLGEPNPQTLLWIMARYLQDCGVNRTEANLTAGSQFPRSLHRSQTR